MYAYAADTGVLRWKSELTAAKVRDSSGIELRPEITIARATAIGLTYVYDGVENLLALDFSNGKLRWRQAVPYVLDGEHPVLEGEAVHLASLNGVHSFHLETGQLLRKVELDGAADLKASDGVLYLTDHTGVVALRAK